MKRTEREAKMEVIKLQVDIRANYRRIAQIEICLHRETCEDCKLLCERTKA